jgi:spermidine synthase
VIGGGDGGTAREVLRHEQVEQCVMVEIDSLVVDACREHIPVTSSVFTHPKLNLLIQDGIEYVANTKEKFDVIIVDSTDPIGPAAPLFNHEFYRNIAGCLSENGIVVSQGESPFYHQAMQKTLLGILHDTFPVSTCYNFTNMSYPGGFWSFTWGSKGLHPVKNFDVSRVTKSNLSFQYYNAEIHRAAFALPSFQRQNLESLIKEN